MARIPISQRVRGKNDEVAERNRVLFTEAGLCVMNVLSSPGSGKTSLLERTVVRLAESLRIMVIDGDVETERDAERMRALGVEALQIQTHGACHLDARRVAGELERFDPAAYDLLLIENIGNLVCPSAFDLGETVRVVVASTTEGDDKPLKYPEAYHTADACVLNKVDLLPHVTFDVEAFEAAAHQANEELALFRTSCITDEGIPEWCEWVRNHATAGRAQPADQS